MGQNPLQYDLFGLLTVWPALSKNPRPLIHCLNIEDDPLGEEETRMKAMRLLMVVAVMTMGMVACGGAPQDDAVAPEKTEVVEPTPVFEDNFETGEVESWAEGEAQAEEESAPEASAE